MQLINYIYTGWRANASHISKANKKGMVNAIQNVMNYQKVDIIFISICFEYDIIKMVALICDICGW